MVDAVETDPFGKVDAIDVLDLASLEARAEKNSWPWRIWLYQRRL